MTIIFTAVFNSAAQAPPKALFYRTDYSISNASNPGSGMVIADLNNDGIPDLAVSLPAGTNVALGNGDGTFQPFVLAGAGGNLSSAAADFDGDGNMDLVLFSETGVVILPGKGDGTFGPGHVISTQPVFFSILDSAELLQVADLNGDGRPDLVYVFNNLASTMGTVVLLNNGDGTFRLSTVFTLSNEHSQGVTVADFNHDGVPDLAVISSTFSLGQQPVAHLNISLGKGNGSFSPPVTSTLPQPLPGSPPLFVAAADFNHDGSPDLAILFLLQTDILLGNGDGSFRPSANVNATGEDTTGLWSIAVGDWTGSGNPGLAIFNGSGGPDLPNTYDLAIMAGNGNGTFYAAGTAVPYGGSSGIIERFLSADLNGDGRPDLVVLGGSTLSVLLNAGASPPLAFVSQSATNATPAVAPGSLATLYASFPTNTIQSANSSPLPAQLAGLTVSVRDTAGVSRPAPLSLASAGQINLQIPPDTAPGVAAITVGNNAGAPPVIGSAFVQNVAPAIFTAQSQDPFFNGIYASGFAIAYGPDDQPQPPLALTTCQASPSVSQCSLVPVPRPAGSRVFLELFCTGIRNHISPVMLSLSNFQPGPPGSASVTYAGAQGQFDGLDQVNIDITDLPASQTSPSGTIYSLGLIVDGLVSNIVQFAVQ